MRQLGRGGGRRREEEGRSWSKEESEGRGRKEDGKIRERENRGRTLEGGGRRKKERGREKKGGVRKRDEVEGSFTKLVRWERFSIVL